jgi:hypothetical protein
MTIETTNTAPESTVEPIDDISHSEEIIVEPDRSNFLPSKTLIAAIFILTISIGTAIFAGCFLWSLSDHQTSAEDTTTTAQTEQTDH